MSEINEMTSLEIVATYTKDDILCEFKKVQAEAGFDLTKLSEANILYQVYMAYDCLKQYLKLQEIELKRK